MLFVVTKTILNQREKTLIDGATDEDVVVLTQNGVYLLNRWSSSSAPVMAIAADCIARGIQVTDTQALTYAQWVSVSEQHRQWVTV